MNPLEIYFDVLEATGSQVLAVEAMAKAIEDSGRKEWTAEEILLREG